MLILEIKEVIVKEIYVEYDLHASIISVPDYIDENISKCTRAFQKWINRTIWENPKLKNDKRYGSWDVTVFVEYLNKYQVKEGDKAIIVNECIMMSDYPDDYPQGRTVIYF